MNKFFVRLCIGILLLLTSCKNEDLSSWPENKDP
mgnify:CR=1 FL=1